MGLNEDRIITLSIHRRNITSVEKFQVEEYVIASGWLQMRFPDRIEFIPMDGIVKVVAVLPGMTS